MDQAEAATLVMIVDYEMQSEIRVLCLRMTITWSRLKPHVLPTATDPTYRLYYMSQVRTVLPVLRGRWDSQESPDHRDRLDNKVRTDSLDRLAPTASRVLMETLASLVLRDGLVEQV